jgi:hypothetical protein
VAATLDDVIAALGKLPQRRRRREANTEYGVGKLAQPTGQPVVCVNTPDSENEERDWTITWQAEALPPGFGGIAPSTTCGVLQCTIRYYAGEVQYNLGPFDVVDLEQHTIDLCARQVDVYFSWANYTGAGGGSSPGPGAPAPLPVWASCGLTKVSHDITIPNPPTWYRTPAAQYTVPGGGGAAVVASRNTQITVPSSGQFKAMIGSVTAVGAGSTVPVYVMLFDAPTTGTAPNATAAPLWTSDAVVQGQSFSSYDATEQTAWIYGLWVGLSSTPATYTPTAGTFSADIAGG